MLTQYSRSRKSSGRANPTQVPTSRTAIIRSTYREIFIDAISHLTPIPRLFNRIETSDRFTVCARVRPLLEQEIHHDDIYECVTTTDSTVTVHAGNVRLNKLEVKSTTFQLDHIFGKYATNQDVYNVVRKTIIQSIPQGNTMPVDSTVFLYGKTATGKSHTISGIAEQFAQDLFNLIAQSSYDIRVGISAVEIVAGAKGFIVSKDNVCDLYNNGELVYFRDDMNGTMHLRGAREYACDNSIQLDELIKRAMALRRTQATTRNAGSSRSHFIYFVRLRLAANVLEEGQILSTITFVDLAGNEGQKDSLYYQGNSDHIRDSTAINRSLSSLQDCIRAAAAQSKVIPFRGTVLTRILKKCFCSEENKTVFIGTLSGLPMDVEQSIQTLRYTGLIKWPIEDFISEETVRLNAPL